MKQFLCAIACVLFLLSSSLPLRAQNIKVFILAGQSNMQGHGEIEPATINGTLSNFLANDTTGDFDYVQEVTGDWATRDDVWVRYDHENGELLADKLSVGFGGYEGQIGPELAFGQLMGEYSQDQILLVKTCWGGKSLAVDFRPPSAGGTVGPYYTQMIADVQTAINNISQEFPSYSGGEIEIAGLCWFQGWNDGEEEAYLNEYEENLKHFITDIRSDLNVPELPVVVGLTGNGGFDVSQNDAWIRSLQTQLVPAQIRAAEFVGFTNVAYAETRDFWREGTLSPEPTFVHHWNNNAESYLRIGDALGEKMIEILALTSNVDDPSLLSNKISLYPSPTTDHFQLSGIQEVTNIKILSVEGKLIKSFISVSEGTALDISDLPKGIYFIDVFDQGDSLLSRQKVIKE